MLRHTFVYKMKKTSLHTRLLITAGIACVCSAWYLGLIPLFSGPARSGVRHALSVKLLPPSARINHSESTCWTDYLFKADLSLAPTDLTYLLSGRSFTMNPRASKLGSTTDKLCAFPGQGFEIACVWTWSNGSSADCTIYANEDRDRVLVDYSSD